MKQLTLSTFPGLDLLGLAFELEGFCVVQGPDLKWGRDVRGWHVPSGRFDGVIGGPPCQKASTLGHLAAKGNGVPAGVHGNQVPEFRRIVEESGAQWFAMENVPGMSGPAPRGYIVQSQLFNNRWLGEVQRRLRKFWFGWRGQDAPPFSIEQEALEAAHVEYTVLAGHGPALGQRVRRIQGRSWQDGARLQGIPESWIAAVEKDGPYTVHGLKSLIGNGVPLPMGRAVARAVKRALGLQEIAVGARVQATEDP